MNEEEKKEEQKKQETEQEREDRLIREHNNRAFELEIEREKKREKWNFFYRVFEQTTPLLAIAFMMYFCWRWLPSNNPNNNNSQSKTSITDTIQTIPIQAPTQKQIREDSIAVFWEQYLEQRHQKCGKNFKISTQYTNDNNHRKLAIRSTTEPILKKGYIQQSSPDMATIICRINTNTLEYRTEQFSYENEKLTLGILGEWQRFQQQNTLSGRELIAQIRLQSKGNTWQVNSISIPYLGEVDLASINNCSYTYKPSNISANDRQRIDNAYYAFNDFLGHCNDNKIVIQEGELNPNSYSQVNTTTLKTDKVSFALWQEKKEYFAYLAFVIPNTNTIIPQWRITGYHCSFKKRKPLEPLKIEDHTSSFFRRQNNKRAFLKPYNGAGC